MIATRSGSGLGDALYLQSVVRHFVQDGRRVEACCDWPDVFLPLRDLVTVTPFRRKAIDLLAHYASRRGVVGTTQFEDCCINAGIVGPVEFRLDWTVQNSVLTARLLQSGRPLILVQMPRAPFARSDGYGMELLPDAKVIQRAIDRLRSRALIVQIGSGKPLHQFSGIDVDLANKTSVSDLIDVASVASGFLSQCSFVVPLAESFGKPALFVWSRRGLNARESVVRQITPKKILHCATSRAVIDDCSERDLSEAVDALCDAIRVPETV